jgi:hypothetical protein
MSLETTARNYFETFEQKDLNTLSTMFHESVTLKDWNIQAEGKAAVVEANKGIFDSVESLSVEVQSLYVSGLTVIAELCICVPNEPPLPVVDVITFSPELEDGQFKIESIVAYRGN